MEGNGDVTNPNGGPPMEGEIKSRVSRYTRETGVDIKYGEKTWRPVQSVVDLVQNHLDANTSRYEKALLGLAGITDYDPSKKDQQETVALLNRIKYASRPQDADNNYAMLIGVLGQSTPSKDELLANLGELNYPLPHVRLKVINGTQSQFVEYDDVKQLSPEWQVEGFRIDDTGSGFDNKLLGMMGASTKKESEGKRGGLGEGLKMSVTHLARSGATVRLLSRNDDELWIARPKVQDGTVVFEGKSKEEVDPKVTGSLTDVDFSSPNFDPKLKAEIVEALDPRKGEGLGKYILEFKDPKFVSIINTSSELSSQNIPGGRVYVKGLLVEEPDNLLWSYNLKEKWAIGGRDRKTVQRDVLMGSIKGVIETINNPEQIDALVNAIKTNGKYIETQSINGGLELDEDKKVLWKESIEKTFNFSPGKQLFASDNLLSEQKRLAEQRGFTIISLPPESIKTVSLFEKLYPDQIVSFTQLDRDRGSDSSTSKFLLDSDSYYRKISSINPELTKDNPVNPEALEVLDKYKNEFAITIGNTFIKQLERGFFSPYQMDRLVDLKFAKAESSSSFELDSPFEYNSYRNTIYVKQDTVYADFATISDLYVQLLKVTTGRDTFEGRSQALLSRMAAESVAKLNPDLLTEFNLPDNGKPKIESPNTYPVEQQVVDREQIEFLRQLDLVNSPDISKEDLEQVLEKMRAIRPTDLSGGKTDANLSLIPREQINSLFYFDGKIFTLNTRTLQLEELKLIETDKKSDKFSFSDLDSKNIYGLSLKKLGDLFGDSKPEPKLEKAESKNPYEDNLFLRSGRYASRFENRSDYRVPLKKLLDPDVQSIKLEENEWAYLPYQLKDNESLRMSFIEEDEREAQLILKRRGNRIITAKIYDGKVDLIKQRKGEFISDKYFGASVEIHGNIMVIRSQKKGSISIDQSERGGPIQLEEANKGKEFISSNVTLDYGGEVWRDPKRILLDAIQNHIDAKRDDVPQTTFTVFNSEGKLLSVTNQELQGLDNSWKIIGFEVADKGEGYTTPYLTKLGSSTKGDEDLGKFGEGLKMLAASAVRQGIYAEFSSRDWVARPVGYEQSIKDYETGRDKKFNMLGYSLNWNNQPVVGSRTNFSLITLEKGQSQLSDLQLADLQKAGEQESDVGKTWSEWTEILDPRQIDQNGQRGLERYVLPKEAQTHSDGVVNLMMDRSGQVYEKGLLIPGEATTPMMFGYNIDETIINTRERNEYNKEILDSYLGEFYKNLTDVDVMKRILEFAKQNPGEIYYEYKFISGGNDGSANITKALWRQTYHEVFGNDAVLSLKTKLQKLNRIAYRDFDRPHIRDPFDFGIELQRVELAHAVANESHLENHNLQVLPEPLTDFFSSEVYTSSDFTKELESAEIEIDPGDKEKLTEFIKAANQTILTLLESMDSNADRKRYLGKVVSPDRLRDHREHLQMMNSENIKIKSSEFPALGMVEEQDGQMVVYLNQKILSNPLQLLDTYVHEVTHYLSEQGDYVLGFQRFLMALTTSRTVAVNN